MAKKAIPSQDRVQHVEPDDRPIEDVLKDMMPTPDEPPPAPTLEELGVNLNPDPPTTGSVIFEDTPVPLVINMAPMNPPAEPALPADENKTTPSPIAEKRDPLAMGDFGLKSKHEGGTLQFNSRITVTEAYQYDGKVAEAPEFVDRNWTTVIQGKPALVMRNMDNQEIGRVLLGDWIIKQDIVTDDGHVIHDKIVPISNEEFQRYFVKKAS